MGLRWKDSSEYATTERSSWEKTNRVDPKARTEMAANHESARDLPWAESINTANDMENISFKYVEQEITIRAIHR
jgi:hypothetical protein